MASQKVIASIEMSNALGLKVGVPVTQAELERQVKLHTKTLKVDLASPTLHRPGRDSGSPRLRHRRT